VDISERGEDGFTHCLSVGVGSSGPHNGDEELERKSSAVRRGGLPYKVNIGRRR